MDLLRASDVHFIVFCDDLSFDGNDASYKSLKAVRKAASRAGRKMSFSTPPPTAGICWRAT